MNEKNAICVYTSEDGKETKKERDKQNETNIQISQWHMSLLLLLLFPVFA